MLMEPESAIGDCFQTNWIPRQYDLDVKERLDVIDSQLMVLIRGQELIIRTLNLMQKQDKTSNSSKAVKRPPSRIDRNNPVRDVSELLHLSAALQENALHFMENLYPNNILDQLVQHDCLSADEYEQIHARTSSKDRVRLLIRKIKTRSPEQIQTFLDIINKDSTQSYLVEAVNKSLQKIIENEKHKAICIICLMKTTVDLKDVGDCLWNARIISDEIYHDIDEMGSIFHNRQYLWTNIINTINESEDPEYGMKVLKEALDKKHGHIVKFLEEIRVKSFPHCFCCKQRRLRPRTTASEYGSTSEISSTSDRYASNIPSFAALSEDDIYDVTQDTKSSELMTYDILKKFESTDSNGHINSTTSDLSENQRPELDHSLSNVSTDTVQPVSATFDEDMNIFTDDSYTCKSTELELTVEQYTDDVNHQHYAHRTEHLQKQTNSVLWAGKNTQTTESEWQLNCDDGVQAVTDGDIDKKRYNLHCGSKNSAVSTNVSTHSHKVSESIDATAL